MAMIARTQAHWRQNEPSGRSGTVVTIVTALVLVAVIAAVAGTAEWVLAVSALCGLPLFALLAFVIYAMGPRSGWAGLWMIRVFRDADDASGRVGAALAAAGRPAQRPSNRAPSRWLRLRGPPKGGPLELADGTCIWFLPRQRRGSMEPPQTIIVLEAPNRTDPVELESLKATVLDSMQPERAPQAE